LTYREERRLTDFSNMIFQVKITVKDDTKVAKRIRRENSVVLKGQSWRDKFGTLLQVPTSINSVFDGLTVSLLAVNQGVDFIKGIRKRGQSRNRGRSRKGDIELGIICIHMEGSIRGRKFITKWRENCC
jgi:hypothetical protein